MRKFLFILAIFAFTLELSAGETNNAALLKISAVEAANYYDLEMIVTGKVVQVTIHPKAIFLNLDKPFPDSPLTVVIFPGHSSFFGDANTLKGKSIEIKGKIKNYKDKPEIVLDSANQLTVLNFTNSIVSTNAPPVAPSTNSFPEIM